MEMTIRTYRALCEDYAGYCAHCDDVTTCSGVEPDAEKYTCPECQRLKMMGLEQAVLLGHVKVTP
jgi:hypothetical protein